VEDRLSHLPAALCAQPGRDSGRVHECSSARIPS
jgi:hypothetical protein